MEALLISTLAVAIAEMGDKTQLLALVLAARYRQHTPIVLGILVATLANHALAGSLGAWVGARIPEGWLPWLVTISLLAMAAWMLVPDKLDDAPKVPAMGAFTATTIAFFLVEMGDKTQIATVVLAAQYQPLWAVVAGTTLGMMLANAPAVWLGARFADRIPLNWTRLGAALLFAALGIASVVYALSDGGA